MRQQSFANLKTRTAKLAATADDTGHSPSDAVALHLGAAQVYVYRREMVTIGYRLVRPRDAAAAGR
jgi:hypothetical protein